MSYVNDRKRAKELMDNAVANGVSVAIFCSGSFWNTEAILLAADNFAHDYNIENIPVAVAMTSHYEYMSQTGRMTRSKDEKTGFLAGFKYCETLSQGGFAPYKNVAVLPHLDHADPVKDAWELEQGAEYLASVMFDAQKYSYEDNMAMTSKYVERYGGKVLVEGIIEGLGVSGDHGAKRRDDYIEKAIAFVKNTGIDYLVADLGTEQQSAGTSANYLKERAERLTEALGKKMLVLHGTSSLKDEDISGFSQDGVVRVNMWTRIVRCSGQYAAKRLLERYADIERGDFEACESMRYINDNIDEAARIMYGVMKSLGYEALGKKK